MRTPRLLILSFLAATLALAAPVKSKWQRFVATAYSVEGETASGKITREGHTVAADPAIIPIGSVIEVKGAGPYSGQYTVHDTGPKINGREIDIFIDNPTEAKRFGKKKVHVRIVKLAPPKDAPVSGTK